jgi:hypothetical protein
MDRRKEILAKLEQIQEQAQLTLDELPRRLAKDRLRLIIGLNWEELASRFPEADAKPPLEAPRA